MDKNHTAILQRNESSIDDKLFVTWALELDPIAVLTRTMNIYCPFYFLPRRWCAQHHRRVPSRATEATCIRGHLFPVVGFDSKLRDIFRKSNDRTSRENIRVPFEFKWS